METHQLSFAQIVILRPDIAEVIINDGIEINIVMMHEYHKFLLTHLKKPFSLLINKLNCYSYDFEAQTQLANLTEVNAMAVITYTKASELATRSLSSGVLRKTPWHLEIFPDRQSALLWLENKQKLTLSR
ncbi:MAG: hypothetical protein COB35_00745 [Gammaproteobacteria bacterium]|nr:MAG: hypothetical protein COB35_00745 [Gammaproteobacteria bacterium]